MRGYPALADRADDADGSSSGARLSGNGRFVAYHSTATNHVEHDNNGLGDVFLTDLK